MHHEYELDNFKAFSASSSMPIRPITLIYGPNSSGKSSILQSLLLMKQTLDEAETPETLLLPKGNLVDLGGYREFIHRHDTERPFCVRLNISIENRPASVPVELLQALGITELGLKIQFGYDQDSASALIEKFTFYFNNADKSFCEFARRKLNAREVEQVRARIPLRAGQPSQICGGTILNKEHPILIKIAELEQQQQFSRLSRSEIQESLHLYKKRLEMIEKLEASAKSESKEGHSRKQRRKSTGLLPEKQQLKEQVALLERQLSLASRPLHELLRSMEEKHQRTVVVARNFLPGEIDVYQGDEEKEPLLRHAFPMRMSNLLARVCTLASQLFRQFLEKLVYLGPLRESPERHYVFSGNVTGQVGKTGRLVPDVLFKNRSLLEKVNNQLAAFGIGYDLVITGSSTGELNDVFSLRLVDRKTSVNASILDVGFGISQVLPIIVQSMLSHGKTLCIEQPEIHLHPRLQAEIGSLLAECIRPPYSNRFIVETHSQHLILRIQRLIYEKKVSNTDISILYVDKNSSGSQCLELRLDRDGEFIDEWPDGFFEEGYKEMFAR